jgi:hypothetical protein
VAVPPKIKNRITCDPAISFFGYISKRLESSTSKK